MTFYGYIRGTHDFLGNTRGNNLVTNKYIDLIDIIVVVD